MNQRVAALRPSPPARVTRGTPRRGLPRLPRGYVPPECLRRLAAQLLPTIVVIQAPQSFGKTTAASWLLSQHDEQRVEHIWVSLPTRPVSRAELWETVGRRLRDAGLAEDDWPAIDRAMARRQRRLVIVVDNLDRVRDTRIDAELVDLVRNHEQIHLIALMREPRPVHVLAVPMDAATVQTDDLILTSDEAREMARLLEIPLTSRVADELVRQLRGWPTLLRLVLSEPIAVTGRSVQVDQGVVDRYVRTLIRNVPYAELRRALQVLSVPELLPRDLAVELVGRQSWSRMSAFLDDLGLAVFDISSREPGPDPIRIAGATMLRDEDPSAFRAVNLTTARWLVARGEIPAALRHARLAQEWDLVYALLTENWDTLLAQQPALVRESLETLPDDMVRDSARLLVARDYILNVTTQSRARSAFVAGLLVPDGAALARSRRRLSLRQVLTAGDSTFYDTPHPFVESRDLGAAIAASGWSDDVVRQIPGLLLDWSWSLLLTSPGVRACYAFAESAEWAEHLGAAGAQRDAAAGAAMSHVVIGNPVAARLWLEFARTIPDSSEAQYAAAVEPLTGAMISRQSDGLGDITLDTFEIPEPLADLEVTRMLLLVDSLVHEERALEAVRMLETFRVRELERGVVSLAEHLMVNMLVETYLASGQVERARRALLTVDPDVVKHPAAWALVDFQSGEYERVVGATPPEFPMPRQMLQLSLLRACAALRLQQRAVAVDAFQSAVSTAAQTEMLRPFALIPRADLLELVRSDVQASQMLEPVLAQPPLLAEPQDGSGLSPRELQVLEAVATGASFAAVASRLFVSPNTVKSQMRDIYRKLGVSGRELAVERAKELGVLRR